MILRPVDAASDILPVSSSSDLLSGPEAVARLAAYKLSLLKGDWWEYPEDGFFVMEFILICSRLLFPSARCSGSSLKFNCSKPRLYPTTPARKKEGEMVWTNKTGCAFRAHPVKVISL